MTTPMPKDNDVDEKVVAWAIVADGYEVDFADTRKYRCEAEAKEYGEGANISIEPLYSAATVAELRAEVERLRAALHIETHKVITCGVAAVHPDASLSRRMEYAGKWNSPQAQHVRVLRDRADAAERRVGELEADARRYRYLRDNANPDSDEGFAVTTEAMKGWGEWRTVHISGADLDSAIDTATGADPT